MKLSATRVKALKDPGRYSDGDGLHLFISKTGGKSWVLRITVGGRRPAARHRPGRVSGCVAGPGEEARVRQP